MYQHCPWYFVGLHIYCYVKPASSSSDVSLQGVTISVSVLTLMCISIERRYAICYPLRFKSTPCRARLSIVVIWIVSTSIVVPELVVLDIHSPSGFSSDLTILLTSCRPTWAYQAAYQIFLIVAMYVLPFAFMFVAYVQIARCLWINPMVRASGEFVNCVLPISIAYISSISGLTCLQTPPACLRTLTLMVYLIAILIYTTQKLLGITVYGGIIFLGMGIPQNEIWHVFEDMFIS